jgi:hypothetical protein
MGYVPLGMQYASKDQKFLIYRILCSIGIRNVDEQKQFMNVLLLKEFDPTKMSKQEAITLIMKLNQIKAEKETR